VLQEDKFPVQFGETTVAKDTDRYRMKLISYSGRLVRLVKTVAKDPNCVLFVTVEIRNFGSWYSVWTQEIACCLTSKTRDKENVEL